MNIHPVTITILQGITGLIFFIPLLFYSLDKKGHLSTNLKKELYQRYIGWLILIPAMIIPLILGREWAAVASLILGLACYKELATSARFGTAYVILCYTGIGWFYICLHFNWYLILLLSIFCALAAIKLLGQLTQTMMSREQSLWRYWGFLLITFGVLHISLLTNIENFQPLILLLLLCITLNDVFAFTCGKLFGNHQLAPNISPQKTVEGAVGAIFLTAMLYSLVASFFLEGNVVLFVLTGIGLSISGQAGDLTFSAFKRTFELKDTGSLIPGHGGLLDRFDSLMLAAPFYYYLLVYCFNAQTTN